MFAFGTHQKSEVLRPVNLDEALQWRRAYSGDAVYISGGTLLRAQWENESAFMPPQLIDLRGIAGMSGIEEREGAIHIGAQTILAACRQHPLLQQYAPALMEAVRGIAAPSIRNLATIGGNVVSATGDCLPALLVYGADLVWYDETGMFTEPLLEWLRIRGSGMMTSERILTAVRIPIRAQQSESKPIHFYQKVGRREAFTPSVATISVYAAVGKDGVLSDVRIAGGGGATFAHRLTAAEKLCEGARLGDAALPPAVFKAVMNQFQAFGDAFASAEYRVKTAANLAASAVWTNGKSR
ncbi:FAD binding domain-containing protein [Paenibacillus beijingensis]|uniref:FAD-binding PCMH-type domain-containing protein n=1 Tax=Paenibacillus beijingensis TaxID=1126833 RepID=A0A0D5NKQ3_9BACL|nr:FAD binding domain-containing protein [Paenibacillus beijingensis]AJY75587.1 hypothetical protein VN24_14745 [Paenibacillus beijingensis]